MKRRRRRRRRCKRWSRKRRMSSRWNRRSKIRSRRNMRSSSRRKSSISLDKEAKAKRPRWHYASNMCPTVMKHNQLTIRYKTDSTFSAVNC